MVITQKNYLRLCHVLKIRNTLRNFQSLWIQITKYPKTLFVYPFFYEGFFAMSKKAIRNFVKAKWPELNEILLGKFTSNLVDCHIETESLKTLAKCIWPHLNHMNLSCNKFSDSGFEILNDNPWMSLKRVTTCFCFGI